MKVSIITPVYNSEKFIKDTISSVLKQTYKNWEMILVDDCSTDNSEQIINEYVKKDSRFKYIKLEQNSGSAVARNRAIKEASGRFLAFLDSDDIWEPEKLDLQIKFMIDNNVGFTFTAYKIIDENGNPTDKIVNVPNTITYEELLKNTIIGCLTVVIDKEIVGEIQMPNLRARQDFATWLSVLKKGYTAYGINTPLAKYRIVTNSVSSNKLKMIRRNWNVYRNIEELSLMKSAYVTSYYVFNAIKKRV
ncbi:glycosyltransferase family 2 protein [Paraclostridium ghonii]|uniref:Teichuronic acid biosynthesis glycosyltransferase TuaG n=1 Tax=Paraclostridium ghonii TaxID=29358 RepID=A0ABU0MVJ3_9FIRM|nr:glycosyltransferase family 2 protein [Paeniclostridium ghonii]MDQ0554900.1 teichuronic acid biosynthesis glycosyltransferase TuaG [Paeniclostridium ghonii]